MTSIFFGLHFLIWAWICKSSNPWNTKLNPCFLTGNHELVKLKSFWSVSVATEASKWLKKRCFHLGFQWIMKNTVTRIDIIFQTLTKLALLHGIWLTSKVSTLEHWRWSRVVCYGKEARQDWFGQLLVQFLVKCYYRRRPWPWCCGRRRNSPSASWGLSFFSWL